MTRLSAVMRATRVPSRRRRPCRATPFGAALAALVLAACSTNEAPAPPDASVSSSASLPGLDLSVDPKALERLDASGEAELEVEAALRFEGTVHPSVRLELHGGYSRRVPKRSYRLTFPDEAELHTALFDRDAPAEDHRRIVLQAAWIDPTFMRNKLTLDLVRALGGLAPRVAYVTVSFNGRPHGLYTAIERIDRPWLRRQGLDPEGNLYKAVNHNANWADKTDPLRGFERAANEENPSDDLGQLLHACSYAAAADFAVEVEPLLSLDDFALWQLVHTFAMDRDTFTKNYYLHHSLAAPRGTPEARFRLISWDADATWGLSWDGTALPAGADGAWHGTDRFAPRLFAIPHHREAYVARYREALRGELAPEAVARRIDAMAGELGEAAARDLAQWSRGVDFDREVSRLRAVVDERHQVMSAALDGLR
ncbi:MAG: CotH kinase family protein [Myxococcales bacterium]